MKFIKPERNIIEKSKYKFECECWRPYTDPVVRIVYWTRLKAIFNYLKNRRWKLILEIGCGYGFFLPSLCQISDKVIGSDIEDMFDFCEKVKDYIQEINWEELRVFHPVIETEDFKKEDLYKWRKKAYMEMAKHRLSSPKLILHELSNIRSFEDFYQYFRLLKRLLQIVRT